MKIIYRISDSGYNKVKPKYINNRNCLWNAVNIFPDADWTILADNISDETYRMIARYLGKDKIQKVSIGHGAGTFNLALDKALTFDDDEIVYFLENDYLHRPNSQKIIEEAINEMGADYLTLYFVLWRCFKCLFFVLFCTYTDIMCLKTPHKCLHNWYFVKVCN
jgi:hypothetical protein